MSVWNDEKLPCSTRASCIPIEAMNHSSFLSWVFPILNFFHDVPYDSELAEDSESLRESVESDNISSL